ncbi:Crp/Fnr family transcriptional regulator [Bosea sp. AAP35]|uniref:Crp/Fnr family transcriptional regulator n=1 Tax=Bosea sp. AAP35 TaxID=1523417 RepID=UPI0006B9251F|nr:Crp/Fnr family transcriptional regulator [Bosea sp. AAP35]
MTDVEAGYGRAVDELVIDRLLPIASRVRLSPGDRLHDDDAVYFPLDAVITLILSRDEARFQIGFARRGDAIGLPALFVPQFPVVIASVLRGGTCGRVTSDVLRQLMAEEPALRERLTTYAMFAMGRYLSEAAGALALSLEQRVARWIMLCRRALEDDILPVTHDGIAEALGVRRSGVTVALHVLEGQRLIQSRRGRIDVLDRDGLRSFAMAARRGPPTNASLSELIKPRDQRSPPRPFDAPFLGSRDEIGR